MIVRITGTLCEVGEDAVIVERDGLAYEILVPRFAVAELAANRGNSVMLHTMQFYEGSMTSGPVLPRIVGFLHPEDRRFFLRFTEVKGIGVRKALKALSEPVRRVGSWIESGDTRSLSSLSGIGKRAAELIVASLRGKLAEFAVGEVVGEGSAPVSELTDAQRDALEIMVSLGDARPDAARWLERAIQLNPDMGSADDLVRAAYRVRTGAEG
ncbi:MAG: Holliday junction branch migration protein RuvA [Planctomycetota bacterium]|jgi:Holliday junction DNA helicase RuvA